MPMRTMEEMRAGCAAILRELRRKKGLSKSKIASIIFRDNHTWQRYEDGTSAPTVPEFLYLHNQLGEDALGAVLRYLYPEQYGVTDDPDAVRNAVVHFVLTVCSDRMVAEFAYNAYGPHGSNIGPQMNMLTMINHLPMEYRCMIASQVDSFYRLAEDRGELVNPDQCPPDLDQFREGLRLGWEAAKEKRQAYSSAVGKEK